MTPQLPNTLLYGTGELAASWIDLAGQCSPLADGRAFDHFLDAVGAFLAEPPVAATPIHLVAAACGPAYKEAALVGRLGTRANLARVTLIDASEPMLAVARQTLASLPEGMVRALRLDLEAAGSVDVGNHPAERRLVTLFGAIGVVPGDPLASLASLVRGPDDAMVVTAYAVPPGDGAPARILASYDNDETRAWLDSLLSALGVPRAAYDLEFAWEPEPGAVGTVRAYAVLATPTTITGIPGELTRRGSRIRVLESARHSRDTLGRLLAKHGLTVTRWAVAGGGAEILALASRAQPLRISN